MNSNASVSTLRPSRMVDVTGIYIHFPYCIQKCSYCDFYSVALQDRFHHNKQPSLNQLDQFKTVIKHEFRSRVSKFRRFSGVNTIYFGGGTASLMPPDLIADLIGMIRSDFDLIPYEDNGVEVPTEITLEGNPENFTPDYLTACQQAGINRINVGIQTFSSEFLTGMNRYFDEDRYNRIVFDLIAFAPPACGIDLIYGFADQQMDQFYDDLNRVLNVGISHLSLYSLTLEEGTPYYKNVSSGSKRAPDEHIQTQIIDSLPSILSSAGFIQYEVSNFARPGYMCRHNLRYWLHESCLALGPGAHGFDGINRYANTRNIQNWQANPLSAPMTTSAFPDDVLIGYLRLCTELSASELSEILSEGTISNRDSIYESIESCFRLWVARGFMDKKFQWTTDGIRYLDDRILEMTIHLEEILKNDVSL